MANPEVDPYNSTYNVSIFRPRCTPSLPPSLLISRNYPSMRCYVGPQLDSFNYVKLRWIARIIRERLTVVMPAATNFRSYSRNVRVSRVRRKEGRSRSSSFPSFRFSSGSKKGGEEGDECWRLEKGERKGVFTD